MALFDFKGWGGTLLGFGAGLAVSSALPGAKSTLRPVTKALVKGMLVAVDGLKEIVSEASEQVNDLIAEVRAENVAERDRKQGRRGEAASKARGHRSGAETA